MEMKTRVGFIYISIFLMLFCSQNAFPLETATHKAINLKIADSTMNGFSLDQYLKNNLGFSQGVGESFQGHKVDEWVRDGGEYEDKPPTYLSGLTQYYYSRFTNHFHNPLVTDISKAGFTGVGGTGVLSGTSAILWSQKAKGTQSAGGNYSWHDVREYYKQALISTDKDVRNKYFAETFRGVGQLMHLVEDMSVPEHTRTL